MGLSQRRGKFLLFVFEAVDAWLENNIYIAKKIGICGMIFYNLCTFLQLSLLQNYKYGTNG